jgi:hypothetical protein
LWEAVRNVTATPGLWRGRLMTASQRAQRWLNIWDPPEGALLPPRTGRDV